LYAGLRICMNALSDAKQRGGQRSECRCCGQGFVPDGLILTDIRRESL
jgi:hypothetical protein